MTREEETSLSPSSSRSSWAANEIAVVRRRRFSPPSDCRPLLLEKSLRTRRTRRPCHAEVVAADSLCGCRMAAVEVDSLY